MNPTTPAAATTADPPTAIPAAPPGDNAPPLPAPLVAGILSAFVSGAFGGAAGVSVSEWVDGPGLVELDVVATVLWSVDDEDDEGDGDVEDEVEGRGGGGGGLSVISNVGDK